MILTNNSKHLLFKTEVKSTLLIFTSWRGKGTKCWSKFSEKMIKNPNLSTIKKTLPNKTFILKILSKTPCKYQSIKAFIKHFKRQINLEMNNLPSLAMRIKERNFQNWKLARKNYHVSLMNRKCEQRSKSLFKIKVFIFIIKGN